MGGSNPIDSDDETLESIIEINYNISILNYSDCPVML